MGLPRKYLPLVSSILAGHTLIFLFNFSDRQLHGVYIATSDGQENISLTAWRGTANSPKAMNSTVPAGGIELELAPPWARKGSGNAVEVDNLPVGVGERLLSLALGKG